MELNGQKKIDDILSDFNTENNNVRFLYSSCLTVFLGLRQRDISNFIRRPSGPIKHL